jgi:RNA polymerase sigma-70 factor (ECF subfamily)
MDRAKLDYLMSRLKRGDEAAFEELYSLTGSGVFSYILSMCRNYHTAEDLMQNTYVQVRSKVDSYKQGTSALAWIYTIAKNLTLNQLSRQKREVSHDFMTEGDTLGGTYTVDFPDSSLFALMRKTLSGTELRIVTLHVIGGFKHREIADLLEKPLGTVLWSYRNALSKMKKALEEEKE